MKPAHTPGPWCLGLSNREVCDLAICTAKASPLDGSTIARLVAKNGTEYNNAKLLAAAPELLQALQDLLVLYQRKRPGLWGASLDQVKAANAAIQKATGAA